jgi:hypothetical protein
MRPCEFRAGVRAGRSAVLAVAVVALSALALAGAAGAGAAVHTRATIFRPFTASGKPAGRVTRTMRGYCWTGSSASGRADAWRCTVRNQIIDPCFSSPKARGLVVCAATGPWSSSLIKIKLTRKLPGKFANKGKPSTTGLPWALRTTSGWKCELATGATNVIAGRRLNYFCTGTKQGLWGSPSRAAQPWRIYAAPPTATTLRRRVGISSAWF